MPHIIPVVARIPLLFLLTLAAFGALAGVASASELTADEQRMVEDINVERRARGLPTLGVDSELTRVARGWTDTMVREGRLYHNSALGQQVQRDWQRLGENVGYWKASGLLNLQLVDRLHEAFMDSTGHRANILEPEYNWVGVGVRVAADGTMWTTVTFMRGAGQAGSEVTDAFRDVTGGVHAEAIRAISRAGVTKGCADGLFCPDRQVTRAQMASFIVRALQLPASSRDAFSDDNGSTHEAAINALAAAGVTGGCAEAQFCPHQPVTRAQMASFLQRAWQLPASSTTRFSDVGSSVHVPAINAIAEAGITLGCGDGRYCPQGAVRRGEMASFLARALGLV